jgi:carbon starvation protein CstA
MIVSLIAWAIVIAIEALAIDRAIERSTWAIVVAVGIPILILIGFLRAWRRYKVDPDALVAAVALRRWSEASKASAEAEANGFAALVIEFPKQLGGQPVIGYDGAGKVFAHPDLVKA